MHTHCNNTKIITSIHHTHNVNFMSVMFCVCIYVYACNSFPIMDIWPVVTHKNIHNDRLL